MLTAASSHRRGSPSRPRRQPRTRRAAWVATDEEPVAPHGRVGRGRLAFALASTGLATCRAQKSPAARMLDDGRHDVGPRDEDRVAPLRRGRRSGRRERYRHGVGFVAKLRLLSAAGPRWLRSAGESQGTGSCPRCMPGSEPFLRSGAGRGAASGATRKGTRTSVLPWKVSIERVSSWKRTGGGYCASFQLTPAALSKRTRVAM